VLNAESFDQLSNEDAKLWPEFMEGIAADGNPEDIKTPTEYFRAFRTALSEDKDLEAFKEAVKTAMSPMDEHGLLDDLQHDFDRDGGSQSQIRVTAPSSESLVRVEDVLIENAKRNLRDRLKKNLPSEPLAEHVYAWLQAKNRLKETLKFDKKATGLEADAAADAVQDILSEFQPGDPLPPGGEALSSESIELLRQEYDAAMDQMTYVQKLAHTLAHWGMYVAIFLLCGFYSHFRQQHFLQDTGTLMRVLLLVVVTVLLCWSVPHEWSETVIIPLLLFSMTIVIAYDQELALLLSIVMAMVIVVSLGFGLTEFTVYVASMSTAVLCLRHIRNRTKLVYVGLVTATITSATAVGVSTLADPLQGIGVLTSAAWLGFFAIVAGLLMTGILPFIENLFDIQTELSLLELGDVAHPLLQELVRRAPGTYNHSITVASIAEAAAEAIGANGLLVRVGAYFHDIGKMLKPGYFIENQSDGDNRHETLLPAMSTLVIIAHVKDGAVLARKHNLPNSLVDFVLQHHGTTLVEYFYNRASEQSETNPDSGEVDEHSYRYPGPKPQTKEAAVLMMADTVESAGRALSDPTPSRIENLVHDLAMKRLLDGQFDECALTLQELHKVERSLTKTLSAVYHGRIKYPDQQSA